MHNHDFLWFSSQEISKRSTTIPVLHNFALTYALSDFSYGIRANSIPSYQADLAQMPIYATPAVSTSAVLTRFTYNAVNSRSLRTDDAPRGVNSPDLGWRVMIEPSMADSSPGGRTGFSFYAFTFDGARPRAVARLGKKGAAVRVVAREITELRLVRATEQTRPTHAVNPLDVGGKIVSYEPVAIPPHLVLRQATIVDDWFALSGQHRIHVPVSVAKKIGLG